MNAGAVFNWVEEHPYAAAALGIIGLFIILWLLGFFSSSKASTGDGGNLAGAYYAAEAAQAQAGAQIQTTTLQTAAATAIASRQAQMTEAVAGIQANAATTINGQNTGAAATINAQNTGAAIAIDAQGGYTQRVLSNDQLQATYNTNYWAGQTAASNNATALSIAQDANRTSIFNSFLNNIVPIELNKNPGGTGAFWFPGLGPVNVSSGDTYSIADLQSRYGYSRDEALRIASGQKPLVQ